MSATKSEQDGDHPCGHYLVAEDESSPSTWHLRVRNKSGDPDHTLMGAAWAALHGGYRGNKYQGPNRDAALSKLKALYKSEKMDTPSEASGRSALVARGSFATAPAIILPEGDSAECDIQWMPPGPQQPVCLVNGEPRKLSFTCEARHADILNNQLQRLLAQARAGEGDRPFTDYDHQDGAASSRPARLYWGGDDPKTGGIRLAGKWTAKARQGIRDGEWDRFSPEWEFHPTTEEPTGINVNLGGLVNRAAFQSIARVVAKHGGAATDNNLETMTKDEISQIITEALKSVVTDIAALKATAKGAETTTAATAQAGAADDKITNIITLALKPLTEKVTAFETAQTNNLKAQAKSAVQVHVVRGAIAPEEKLPSGKLVADYWADQWLANPADAEVAMAKLPGKRPTRLITSPSNGGTYTTTAGAIEPEDKLIAMAKDLREKNKAIASDAAALEALMKTAEGRALYEQFRNDIVSGAAKARLPQQNVK